MAIVTELFQTRHCYQAGSLTHSKRCSRSYILRASLTVCQHVISSKLPPNAHGDTVTFISSTGTPPPTSLHLTEGNPLYDKVLRSSKRSQHLPASTLRNTTPSLVPPNSPNTTMLYRPLPPPRIIWTCPSTHLTPHARADVESLCHRALHAAKVRNNVVEIQIRMDSHEATRRRCNGQMIMVADASHVTANYRRAANRAYRCHVPVHLYHDPWAVRILKKTEVFGTKKDRVDLVPPGHLPRETRYHTSLYSNSFSTSSRTPY